MSTRLQNVFLAAPAFILFAHVVLERGSADQGQAALPQAGRTDSSGDILPPGILARMGTLRWRHGEPVATLVFAPEGRALASAGGDVVRLWDVGTGTELQQFAHDLVCAVAFSRDGKTLATASGTGTLCLWQTATGKQLQGFGGGYQGKVHALAFSPDGKFLASGNADRIVRLWEVATGKEVRQYAGHEGQVFAVAFSPDGKFLAAGSKGLRLWEVDTGKLAAQFGGEYLITTVGFSDTGQELAAGEEDQQVRFWDLTSRKEVRKFRGGRGVALAVDARHWASVGKDHTVRLGTPNADQERRGFAIRDGDADLLALSPDGKRLASVGANGVIRVWDVATGKEPLASHGHQGRVAFVAYAPDGRSVTTGSADGTLCQWDAATGKERPRLQRLVASRQILAVSADGKLLAYRDQDRSVRLWNCAEGKELQRWAGPEDDLACCAAFSPDCATVALGYPNHPLRLVDLASPNKSSRSPGPRSIQGLVFSPDDKTLAFVAEDGKFHFWDLARDTEIAQTNEARTHGPAIFSPDGRQLASCMEGGIICVWETATGKELRQYQGHPDVTCALAFSPDGRVLASGGADPFVRLWETASGQGLRRLAGHRGPVTAVAFAPDGLTLVSGSTDTTLLLWDLGRSRSAEPVRLEPARLESLWTTLAGGDGSKAYDAIWTMTAAPKDSLPFLLDRLQLFFGADQERITRMIADLDHDEFSTRERATADLMQLGKLADPMLRKALAKPPSLEVQRRIERILQKIKGGVPWAQERLRLVRLMEVLEKIGTAEARQGLEKLAQRAPEPDLKQEASAALERLARRTSRAP
jgi:WD40 repeat protein